VSPINSHIFEHFASPKELFHLAALLTADVGRLCWTINVKGLGCDVCKPRFVIDSRVVLERFRTGPQ